MPVRMNCCTGSCSGVPSTCSPALRADWENACPDQTTYNTYAVGYFEGCSETIRLNFDYSVAMNISVGGGEYELFWNDFAGHFSWTMDDPDHHAPNYVRDWQYCNGQGGIYADGGGFLCDGFSGDEFSYCFGAASTSEAGNCSSGECGNGMTTDPCYKGGTGGSLWTYGRFAEHYQQETDADWHASGIKISGDSLSFDPTGNGASCGATGDYYQRKLRKITLTPTSSTAPHFRITWYFSGNPAEEGSGTPLCYYNDFSISATNQFGEFVDCVNAQNQYGIRATGSSTKLWASARIEDGNQSTEHDITNGSVEIYYKKPKKYRYYQQLGQSIACYKAEYTPDEDCPNWHTTPGEYDCDDCECAACCGEVASFNWCNGLATAYSPWKQILTSEQSEDWDDCPNGDEFGGDWTSVPIYIADRVTDNGCTVV